MRCHEELHKQQGITRQQVHIVNGTFMIRTGLFLPVVSLLLWKLKRRILLVTKKKTFERAKTKEGHAYEEWMYTIRGAPLSKSAVSRVVGRLKRVIDEWWKHSLGE